MAKAKPKPRSLKVPRRSRNKRMAMGKKLALKGEGFERFGWPLEGIEATSKMIRIKAAWDAEAKVWYIEDSSLTGLHLEAETLDELHNKLPGAIEDLLEGSGERDVPFEFIALGHATIPA